MRWCLLRSTNDTVALRVTPNRDDEDNVIGGVATVYLDKLQCTEGKTYSIDFQTERPAKGPNVRFDD
ncbi:MAG: hypothetical protein PHZ00_07930 [Candidatus Peribacteraceae bacterium]|nr:hypothetical protein [Candidatus Peribacteraceae bacterium]